MIRVAAGLLALAPLLALASAAGSIRPIGVCPGAQCLESIEVRVPAPLADGAVFVGFLPIGERGEPRLPGAFFGPSGELEVSPRPIAVVSGRIGAFARRFEVRGGVCALAEAQGVRGLVGLYAGYGIADPGMVARFAQLQQRVAQASPEAQAKLREAMARVAALQPVAVSAADDMLARRTFWLLTTVRCEARS